MPAIDRVIVGVNDSPRNLPALRYAAALASSHFTPLFLVLAWVPPGGEYADLGYSSPWLRQEWEKAARERLREDINAAFGGLPAEVSAEPVTIRGPAGPSWYRQRAGPVTCWSSVRAGPGQPGS